MENLELSLNEMANASNGQVLNPQKQDHQFSEMVYDSRKITPQSIFWCIAGNRVDGHNFISDAIQSGAALIVGDNEKKIIAEASQFKNVSFLVVGDVLKSLQGLATYYRKKFNIPVAALTGSSGKTTTKDLVASIFSVDNKVLVTQGSLNNHWGVPQTVLCLRSHHRAAVFELGTSGIGEIHNLASICQPRIGFITTIGSSHLSTLENEEGVLKAKREIDDWIIANNKQKTLIFNLDNPYLEKLHFEILSKKDASIKIYTLSQKKTSADCTISEAKPIGEKFSFGWEYEMKTPWGKLEGILPLPGEHNLLNALSAACLAFSTGLARIEQVQEGLKNPKISKLRSHIFRIPLGSLVYDDTYNANPSSVAALFNSARAIVTQADSKLLKTIAVVGDMLELGANAKELHNQMGEKAAQCGIEVLFAYGEHALDWTEGYRKAAPSSARIAQVFKTKKDLISAIFEAIKAHPKDVLILVKGSRGAQMDEVVTQLAQKA